MSEKRPVRIVPPSAGPIIDVVGDRYRFLARSEDTTGRYSIWEAIVPPGGGPPPHVHGREDEGFYVLEGEVTFEADGETHVAPAGTFVHAPSGSLHAFRNATGSPARMLILIAPGGMEAMFAEVGTSVDDPDTTVTPPSDDENRRLLEVAPRYDVEIHLPKH